MKKSQLLLAYQLLIGASDSATGLLLLVAPALTLHLMRLQAPDTALPYLSYIGAFVLSVGLACWYGAMLAARPGSLAKLEVVWLLTGITRAIVALFVLTKILSGGLEAGWLTVAVSDGVLAGLQFVGLARGWLRDATL
ncbi:hypothetical protein SAMN05421771_2947 [Granulicella pectinivorans]|jgi:hypothetical protein|uniref:Uncharacterized protein n=1 Tax=Granulicella pectinivorans TaxID=474950 RepID=A0A1I6MLX5_9BACT|nr:hypothetical protein [Granulicella pectinivorans]SFS16644.1 hypothetical protein SAMN05421771_2947 [Granulicella pectinivorans]